jgi:hypothetical protein
MSKLDGKSRDELVTSMVKQLLADRDVALKNGQGGSAVEASRAIASLLGLQLDGPEKEQQSPVTVIIDQDLAKVVRPPAPAPEPSPEDRELAQKLLALLEKNNV